MKEDLINKNYISSDDIVTDIYDAINIRIKKGSQTFSDNLKMTMADLIAANIIYKWRYRKTVNVTMTIRQNMSFSSRPLKWFLRQLKKRMSSKSILLFTSTYSLIFLKI